MRVDEKTLAVRLREMADDLREDAEDAEFIEDERRSERNRLEIALGDLSNEKARQERLEGEMVFLVRTCAVLAVLVMVLGAGLAAALWLR